MPKLALATSLRPRSGRSPVTEVGYRAGLAPKNKGLKLPAELLTHNEVRALLDSFGSSVTGVRNHALVLLMYRAALKIGEVVALERRHYELGSDSLTVPATGRARERTVALDAETRAVLDRWMELRKVAGVRVTAPLFCTISAGAKGNRLYTAYVREALKDKAQSLGIDRRTTCEGLRRSGIEHRARSYGRIATFLAAYVDEESFRSRYPDAFRVWESAVDLFALNPVRNASRIGHDCREAMLVFVDDALERCGLQAPGGEGTVTKLRRLIAQAGPRSGVVAAHLKALVTYWGATSDLVNRQEHAAARQVEPLAADDSQRIVFHTMLLMLEIDRSLR